jgi:hypothetical protein
MIGSSKLLRTQENQSLNLCHRGQSANSKEPWTVDVRLQAIGLVDVVLGEDEAIVRLKCFSSRSRKTSTRFHIAATLDSKTDCREQCRQEPEANKIAGGLPACRTPDSDVIAPTMMSSRDTGPSMVFACQSHRDVVLDIEKRRR